ncbi:DMT family transporter [Marivita hallyeonensis]|uniref:Permease of the drug/metabolite transporter (DMT) superfamily n=1 Tax=Marivita hallyeonensis TaxID=996342 RepID=A0A1M5VUG8_9RHOB|nr:DMT family transporter [Marivita hallyeonensis]SHH78915.1 Permease of the drug/metabolite transporter (DMT) superfamily [Marivita hallyeonensis]
MQTIRAILLMILAMALLALSDMFIKLSSRDLSPGHVMFFLSAGGTLCFVLIAKWQGAKLITRDALHPWVLARGGLEIIGGLGLVLSIGKIPLSLFAAIMQMAPLVVTLGAAVFLKETVGTRRWIAIFVGIFGMLLVIRPGAEDFEPAALFAVMGVCGLGLRDLITRLAPRHIPSISLATWGFSATIPTGLILVLALDAQANINATSSMNMLGAIIVTALGYYAVTQAMRMAPASIVSPFRYTRLVFTMSLGILVFAEQPDGLTLLGAGIILAAGLYALYRERQLALAAEKTAEGTPR